MLVEDFNAGVFSALFKSAGERLRLKQFVQRNTEQNTTTIPVDNYTVFGEPFIEFICHEVHACTGG